MSVRVRNAPSFCNQDTKLLPYLEQLSQEVKVIGESRFLSVTTEIGYSDPLAILEAIHKPNEAVCYLERPANEFSIACGEFLADAKFEGLDRFKKAKQWSKEIFKKTFVAGDHKIPGTGPTMFMAASFEPTKDCVDCPPALQIFLPRWQVVRKGGLHYLISNIKISQHSSPKDLDAELSSQIWKLNGMRFALSKSIDAGRVIVGNPIENFHYEQAVHEALEEINSGKLSKVVLARQLIFQINQELPPFSIAHALRERFPDCFTFCLSTPNSGMMVGATPETLLRASGTVLETEAVAGSAPRGPSAGRDAHWGKTLLARKKEVHEHRVVIDSILRRLKSIGLENCHEGKPRLLRLANLQHVRTPLRVESHDNIHPFDALSALHPTPAMGGSPREIALPLVRKLEISPRGWYSGITGWIDNRGRGEFVVPIRCGKLYRKSLTLYAGAGVVSGSSPAQEKIETDWKLKAMLDVITGKSDFSGET